MKPLLHYVCLDQFSRYQWFAYSVAGIFLCCSKQGFETEEEAVSDMYAQMG